MGLAVTVPDTLEVIVGERLNLSIDFTNLIAPGDALSLPLTTVESAGVDELVPSAIIGVPAISNNVILTVTVSSAPLRPSSNYVVTFSATATGGAGTKNVSALLTLKVIY